MFWCFIMEVKNQIRLYAVKANVELLEDASCVRWVVYLIL